MLESEHTGFDGFDYIEWAPPVGSAEAGAAATGGLAAGERAPSSGSAEAGAAAMEGLDYIEQAPPVGSVEAREAAKVFSQSLFYTASEWIQSGLFKIHLRMGCSA